MVSAICRADVHVSMSPLLTRTSEIGDLESHIVASSALVANLVPFASIGHGRLR